MTRARRWLSSTRAGWCAGGWHREKVTRDNVIVDLGNNAEGLLPRDQLVGRETFRVNDRVRAILKEISEETAGPS